MDSETQSHQRDLPKEPGEVSVETLTDPTAVSDSMEVLNQDVVNLSPDGFEVRRVTVPLAECCLIYHRCNLAVRPRTRIHVDFDAYTILGPQSRGSISGMELHPYALIVAARVAAAAENTPETFNDSH
jgi:hypothetical protein